MTTLRSMTYLAHAASSQKDPKYDLTFDSDSYQIMVDNGASYSITNNIDDFIKPPDEKGAKIKGFDGSITRALVGTVRWKIMDDKGKVHNITLPRTSYVPNAETRLLSPQHWAQTSDNKRGTFCTTYGDCMVLRWDNKKYKKTIPICPTRTSNVGLITSAYGNRNHVAMCSTFERTSPQLAYSSTIEFDTEGAVILESDHESIPTMGPPSVVSVEFSTKSKTSDKHQLDTHPLLINFDEDLDQHDQHPTFGDTMQEYMHWHYRLNHASFATMLRMAKSKLLPQDVSSTIKKMDKNGTKPPLCSDCVCAKACRKQWRQKQDKESL
jgi:hypothetical protein